MTDTDAATHDRLATVVDGLPIDVDAQFARVTLREPKRQPRRWPVAAGALAVALAAIAFLVWAFVRHDTARPAGHAANGRIAFVDYAPGYHPPKHGGFNTFPDLDLYTMNPDGTDVRSLTSGRTIDYASSWSPDGKRLALVRGDRGPSNVFVMNVDGTGVQQITFCRYSGCIQHVAWSPRSDWLAYQRGHDLYLIRSNGADNHLISRCPNCVYAGLSWSPDATELVLGTTGFPGKEIGGLVIVDVGAPTTRGLRRVRPITFCHLRRPACRGEAHDIDPSWSNVGWISFSHGSRVALVRPDGTNLHLLQGCVVAEIGKRQECRASSPIWSPDGTEIAFDGLPGIYVMNADGTGLVQIRRSGHLSSWQAIRLSSPEPVADRTAALVFERIASCGFGLCSGDRPDPAIVVANPDGSDVRAIRRGTEPVSVPDGTKLVFKGLDGDLYVMRSDGSGVTRIFNCRAPDCHGMNDPTWSPSGKQIAFAGAVRRGRDFLREIYVINADGSGLRRETTCIAPECSEHVSPSFSPDGQSIAFEADIRAAGSPVYETLVQSLDLGTGQIQTVYRCASECSFQGGLDWSPDGRSIVYGLGSGLFVASLDGSPIRQLTTDSQDVFPSWSPDGRLIAFTRYPNRSTGGIYVVVVENGDVNVVVPGGSRRWSYLFPSWLPG